MPVQNRDYCIEGYEIPEVTLTKGEMIRFWVEIVPEAENDIHFGIKEMQEVVNCLDKKAMLCPNKINRRLIDFVSPSSTSRYLSENFKLEEKEIESILSCFNIKQEWKVKDLGSAHQKVFSIICEFQKFQVIAFYYYGLSPSTADQLTEFVRRELKNGKTVISFDNLKYKPENLDSHEIRNLDIRKKEL